LNEAFVVDMGARPTDKTLDRINTESGYSPENCQWATRETQANNRRNNRIIEYKGESLTLMQWSKRKGIKYDTLFRRLEAGWSIEKTLTEKLHHPHYK